MLNKMAISEFLSGGFGKRLSVGGGLGVLQFFGHLKRALELFISVRMSPHTTFQDQWVDTITPGKKNDKKKQKKKQNKHASVLFLVEKKMQNSTNL